MFDIGFHSARRFMLGTKALDVERLGKDWKLSHHRQIVRTRDLSSGVDDLLGKSQRNMDLVLRILEWDSEMRHN